MDMEKKRKEKKRHTRAKAEYENPARLFGTEGRRPAQKPTPKGPSQGTHPRENAFGKGLKNTAIRSEILAGSKMSIHHKYCRPRSYRMKVAESRDPRTNVTLLYTTTTTNQKIKALGRSPLTINSSLQTLKLQPHASPHLGTDLCIAQLSNIGSFNHHLSTTGRAFATNAGTQN
ncbi:hypothetical protein V1477_017247 [Vespula maculifrons]|uniref:Uncharacterized protein n=1 Tax=Vespula maculifrons TaxID=7453 RepID=A0ABD2B5K9_VESMC